jgi:hypothetical protein
MDNAIEKGSMNRLPAFGYRDSAQLVDFAVRLQYAFAGRIPKCLMGPKGAMNEEKAGSLAFGAEIERLKIARKLTSLDEV